MLAAALLVFLLAGCSQPPAASTDEAADAPPALGTLRGVVVDDAIRPLGNVTVTLQLADGTALNATTPADGEFAFADLAAGAYVVKAARRGYFEAQVTATVLSSEETPAVRLVLPVDAATAPSIESFVFAGFLQCSVTALAARVAACNPNEALAPVCALPVGVCSFGPANLTQDQFLALHTLGGSKVAFLQSEMHWQDSSGGLGANLRALPGARTPGDGKIGDYRPFEGPSPLIMPMPGNLAQALLLGNGRDYIVRVFSGYMDGTAPPCLPAPVGCAWGVGVTLQQKFDLYTHVFYNMQPPADWQFGRDGVPPIQ